MRLACALLAIAVAAPLLPGAAAATSIPIELRVVAGVGNASLSWNGTDGLPATFRVYRGVDPANLTFIAILGNVTEYEDRVGLDTGREFWWQVRGLVQNGTEYVSPAVNATPRGPPWPPLNLTLARGEGNVTLSWRPPDNDGGAPVQRYLVYRGAIGGDTVYFATTLATTFVDPLYGNADPARLDWAVAAVSELGVGRRTPAANFSAAGTPPAEDAAEPAPDAANATPRPARVVVANLSIDPNPALPAELVNVTAVVANEGGLPSDESLVLRLDGEDKQTVSVKLDPGASMDVKVQLIAPGEGNHTLELGEANATLRVVVRHPRFPVNESPLDGAPSDANESPAPGPLVALALAALLLRRR